jgi:hypothetical protein
VHIFFVCISKGKRDGMGLGMREDLRLHMGDFGTKFYSLFFFPSQVTKRNPSEI